MINNILSIFNPKKVVGLYISQETVDLVVLKSSLKGPQLVKFGQTYIYPKEERQEIIAGSIEDKEPSELNQSKKTNRDYLIEAIKRVFKENNVKPGNVATAIPSEDAMVRYFQMPKIPKQEWQTAINFEAKRYIPFRMEDVISDFQVIPSHVTPNVMDVLFVAVKKDAVERFVELLTAAGLRPIIMEPAPFSLMRAFNAAEQINNKINTAIIDIDSKTMSIDILRSGIPYIIRDIPLSEDLSENKPHEPIFEKLLKEIKLSFDFYEKQFPNEVIDKIIIYSRVPLENWHELVGRELQIPIEVGDPLRSIKIKESVVPLRAAVCFGLALRGLSQPFIEINLCKEKLLVHKKKELFLKMVFLEASASVFLLIILKVLSMKAMEPLANELKHTLSERPKVEVNIKSDNIEQLEKIKNEMEAKRHLLENLIVNRTYVTTRLMDLVKLVPKNMWLEEVNFEEKAQKKNIAKIDRLLNIKGYCIVEEKLSETDIVNDFLVELKGSKGIKEGMNKFDIVSVKKVELKGKKFASFEILFTGQ